MLSGPVIEPAQGQARNLVVLLHGYGANGDDLISLGRVWQKYLPYTAFMAPNAPSACAHSPFFGRQWFDLSQWTQEALLAGVRSAAPELNAFIDAELQKRNLGDEDLVIGGFSQGAMMALHTGLTRPKTCAGVLSYAGALLCEPHEVRSKPSVMLVHGRHDQVVLFHEMENAASVLSSWDIDVVAHPRPELAHSIDEEAVNLGRTFIAEKFENAASLAAARG